MKFFFYLSVFFTTVAGAYPEMIRHGYANCLSCHLSPNGGGLLTSYGRSLSGEILSTWATENEGQLLHGLVAPSKLVSFGGDFRSVQLYRDTSTAKDARFTVMQADLEGALHLPFVSVVPTVGYLPASGERPAKLFSPRHYVLVQPTEKLNFRFGKFLRAYGINTPDHQLAVRRRLKIDPGNESYHLETSYLDNPYEVFLTGTLGSLIEENILNERGASLRLGRAFQTSKLGLSYAYLTGADMQKHQVGPWALVSLSSKTLLNYEANLIFQEDSNSRIRGFCGDLKLDQEWFQGFHTYLTHEADWLKTGETLHTLGIGTQFFPRPHFELALSYLKTVLDTERSSDTVIFLMHYYL